MSTPYRFFQAFEDSKERNESTPQNFSDSPKDFLVAHDFSQANYDNDINGSWSYDGYSPCVIGTQNDFRHDALTPASPNQVYSHASGGASYYNDHSMPFALGEAMYTSSSIPVPISPSSANATNTDYFESNNYGSAYPNPRPQPIIITDIPCPESERLSHLSAITTDSPSPYSPFPLTPSSAAGSDQPQALVYQPNQAFELGVSDFSMDALAPSFKLIVATEKVREQAEKKRKGKAKFFCNFCGADFTARHNLTS
ncbi:hypothetical protein D9757_001806 [Collybiopsis confluens]|uniref:Uncharacterized protein n=1 Tax=Collybiopsis confluens TaxID=2823264 RepID=A0A8H5MF53_9AGAR|nr:hypothetical protein D9757_001806 [Collybiopsis confluens]